MANALSKNNSCVDTVECFFAAKTLWAANGAPVGKSGTGTAGSFSGSSDLLTTATIWKAARAWAEVSLPGSRAITIQRTTTNSTFRIKFVNAASFNAGSPDAQTTPSHANEIVLIGSGTDASPTGASLGTVSANGQSNTYLDTVTGGTWVSWIPSGGGPDRFIFLIDPVTQADTGDTDPCVACAVDLPTNVSLFESANARARINGTVQGVGLASYYGLGSSARVAPDALPTFAITSRDVALPAYWGRAGGLSSPNGIKGKSSLFLTNGVNRNSYDTLSIGSVGAKDKIVLSGGGIAAYWDGTTPTI